MRIRAKTATTLNDVPGARYLMAGEETDIDPALFDARVHENLDATPDAPPVPTEVPPS